MNRFPGNAIAGRTYHDDVKKDDVIIVLIVAKKG